MRQRRSGFLTADLFFAPRREASGMDGF